MLVRRICAALVLAVAACGKPADPSGGEDRSFTKASMGFEPSPSSEPGRPLAADLAIEAGVQ